MSIASMSSAAFWANRISTLSAQRTARALAAASAGSSTSGPIAAGGGGNLFADLVSTLTQGAVTVNGGGAATPATPASHSQIAQDLQAFSQSLSTALASNRASADIAHLKGTFSKLIGDIGGASSGHAVHVLA